MKTEAFYYDKDDNPCKEEEAVRMSIVAYDDDGNVIPDMCCTSFLENKQTKK